MGYLAERANVTKPIPYDHFGDREGLLMALYQDYSDRQLAKFRETLAVDSKTLDKTIRFFSAAYIDCAMTAGPETGPITAAALSGSRALQSFREACVAECADCLRTCAFPFCRPERRSGEIPSVTRFWSYHTSISSDCLLNLKLICLLLAYSRNNR